jgi:hypothetical protein
MRLGLSVRQLHIHLSSRRRPGSKFVRMLDAGSKLGPGLRRGDSVFEDVSSFANSSTGAPFRAKIPCEPRQCLSLSKLRYGNHP